jgi:hypothetical protein
VTPSDDKHQRSRAAIVKSGVRFVHRAPRSELIPHGENDFTRDDSLCRSADVSSAQDNSRRVYGVMPSGSADELEKTGAFYAEGLLWSVLW